jgi:serine/threonine protein kinase
MNSNPIHSSGQLRNLNTGSGRKKLAMVDWLERCTKGKNPGYDVRATKQMEVRRQVDYARELEAIAKFSHRKVCLPDTQRTRAIQSAEEQYERCFVKSYGWYQHEASLFIAMEYLELGDLQDYLLDNDKLQEYEAQCIMSQILEGLDLMHDNGFAHRDLKPNVSCLEINYLD